MTNFVLMGGGHEEGLRKYVGSGFEGHPLWICRYLAENPEALRKVCQEYIQAGAQMVLTNTYQATVEGFKNYMNLSREQSIEIIKLGVRICKEAIELEQAKGITTPIAVVGCVGPYGAFLHDGSEYAGGYYVDSMTVQELVEWHRPRVEALLEAGADSLLFGTIPSFKEAKAFITLLKEFSSAKMILSFSAQNEETISHGERISEVAKQCWDLASEQILAIGVNCQHPNLATALVRSVRKAYPQIPLFIRPNNTEVFNTTTKQWEAGDNTKSLNEYCREWLDLEIQYISGCCRTTCQDLKGFKEEIYKFKNKAH